METAQLKFVLRLLGTPNYRSHLTGKGFKDIKGKEKICRQLRDRGLVNFSEEIGTVKILPPGQVVLEMDREQLPIGGKQLKLLEKIALAKSHIAPSKVSMKSLKSAERDEILQGLAEKGLIETTTKMKRQKAEVWLTEEGLTYLREEFVAKGTHPVISLDLLTNYLSFLRQSSPTTSQSQSPAAPPVPVGPKPTDEEILQLIKDLDRELGTENYLPIFHLRQKLQPPFSRQELDLALYRLQKADKLDLSSLVETIHYTKEQIQAGIAQDTGAPLFFLIVN